MSTAVVEWQAQAEKAPMHRHDIIINKTNFAGISNYSKVSLWALEEIHKLKGKLNSALVSNQHNLFEQVMTVLICQLCSQRFPLCVFDANGDSFLECIKILLECRLLSQVGFRHKGVPQSFSLFCLAPSSAGLNMKGMLQSGNKSAFRGQEYASILNPSPKVLEFFEVCYTKELAITPPESPGNIFATAGRSSQVSNVATFGATCVQSIEDQSRYPKFACVIFGIWIMSKPLDSSRTSTMQVCCLEEYRPFRHKASPPSWNPAWKLVGLFAASRAYKNTPWTFFDDA
ncbi:hypothetical protein KC346_g23 [Hortaea werneckii]|nr:hypothetical protein KC346_g23 [Hortaea werneckii]